MYGATQQSPSSSIIDIKIKSGNNSDTNNEESKEAKARKRIFSHCHIKDNTVQDDHHKADNRADINARNRLIAVSVICCLFMIAEIVGGLMSNSLAIATDAAHLLTDLASFMISLFSIWLSSRPATKKMNFGWYRAEVIGALISVLMIWVVTVYLVIIAAYRIKTQEFDINSTVMLITAAVGLLVNLVMGLVLSIGGGNHHHHHHQHSHQNNHHHHTDHNHSHNHSHDNSGERLNIRAAIIHIIGDFLQSLGVLIAALIVYFKPEYQIVDPICTFFFSFLVLITTIKILKDAMNVLMEGMPNGINFLEVRDKLQNLPGVIMVHNLRIWSLSLEKIAISTHLVIDEAAVEPRQALKSAIHLLQSKYNFFEATIQIEEYGEDMRDCSHCYDDSNDSDSSNRNNNITRNSSVKTENSNLIDISH